MNRRSAKSAAEKDMSNMTVMIVRCVRCQGLVSTSSSHGSLCFVDGSSGWYCNGCIYRIGEPYYESAQARLERLEAAALRLCNAVQPEPAGSWYVEYKNFECILDETGKGSMTSVITLVAPNGQELKVECPGFVFEWLCQNVESGLRGSADMPGDQPEQWLTVRVSPKEGEV